MGKKGREFVIYGTGVGEHAGGEAGNKYGKVRILRYQWFLPIIARQ
jgi:hypothetical protein